MKVNRLTLEEDEQTSSTTVIGTTCPIQAPSKRSVSHGYITNTRVSVLLFLLTLQRLAHQIPAHRAETTH